MTKEQPDAGQGNPLDTVLQIIEHYAEIARKLEADIIALTGFLKLQGTCPYVVPSPRLIVEYPPLFSEEVPIVGYLGAGETVEVKGWQAENEDVAWLRITIDDKVGWISTDIQQVPPCALQNYLACIVRTDKTIKIYSSPLLTDNEPSELGLSTYILVLERYAHRPDIVHGRLIGEGTQEPFWFESGGGNVIKVSGDCDILAETSSHIESYYPVFGLDSRSTPAVVGVLGYSNDHPTGNEADIVPLIAFECGTGVFRNGDTTPWTDDVGVLQEVGSVYAVIGGRVVETCNNDENAVIIEGDDNNYYVYLHIVTTLQVGDEIDRGEVIGRLARISEDPDANQQPHLHFEVRKTRCGAAMGAGPFLSNLLNTLQSIAQANPCP